MTDFKGDGEFYDVTDPTPVGPTDGDLYEPLDLVAEYQKWLALPENQRGLVQLVEGSWDSELPAEDDPADDPRHPDR